MYGKRSIAAALLMLFAAETAAADVLLASAASSRAVDGPARKVAITSWDQNRKPMGRARAGTALMVTGLVMGGIGMGFKFGDPTPENPRLMPFEGGYIGSSRKTYNAVNYLLMAGGGLLMISGSVMMSSSTSVSAQATPEDGSRLAVSVRF